MTRIAKRTDWQNHPMPNARRPLTIERQYSKQEFARLASGLVPAGMDDKWFIFYEAPWLYLHRSWTGFCVYQVRFEALGTVMAIAEAFVNADETQHQLGTGKQDVLQLCILMDALIGRATKELFNQYLASRRKP